jgi:glycosyltransferase involved in cell wall biosynthesis
MRVAVGVHTWDRPDLLATTLARLARYSPGVVPYILGDGADAALSGALPSWTDVPQLLTADPEGAPACFNRLCATEREADWVVMLENGCFVAPAWLDRLLAAGEASPDHGLAGPSTNRSWNEQAVMLVARDAEDDVAAAAAEVARRFGAAWRSLEPLHSLADFCYAVRRDVREALGEADETYGEGPCWEMDYNIRAARAGFRGVWACGAFVYRSSPSPRRVREERARFEVSRHRYQDKFCALRLRGERSGYEPHCRGDACEHFAPPDRIEIRRTKAPPIVHVAIVEERPLVSCLMPTRDRTELAVQSARYFLRQDVAESELIVLDDGDPALERSLPADARIRYERMPARLSIGEKRNRGCELARGRYIAQWDDDDWHGPTRLSAQLAPLLDGSASICGLTADHILSLPDWRSWRLSPALHRRLFAHDVHGGTLVFDRRIWLDGARYPHTSLAEDAWFLRDAIRRGARLARVDGKDRFVYIRHARNSWRFECGTFLDRTGWQAVEEPGCLQADRGFYLSLAAPQAVSSMGLVTCIMPTRDRRHFVPRAIAYFQRQDYAERELIIVDDGEDAVADLVPSDARIRYVRLDGPRSVGAKRNLACEMAHGVAIAHWDDDDWSAPSRLSTQMAALAGSPQPAVCGSSRPVFYAPPARAWRFHYMDGRPWVHGATMCYHAALWRERPFVDRSLGEDTCFVWGIPRDRIIALADTPWFIALVHASNTGAKPTSRAEWHGIDAAGIRAVLGDDVGFYDQVIRRSQPDGCEVVRNDVFAASI